MIASPSPVHDTPPSELSAYVPHPISAVSPTRPGRLPTIPPVDVAAATVPWRSSAVAPTVPREDPARRAPAGVAAASSARRTRWRSMTSDAGSHSGSPAARANTWAPSATRRTWRPSSSTRRARATGFAMPPTAAGPPWTMIDGTRRPHARECDGAIVLTVAQSGRLAKPDGARAAQRADRTMPPLHAARRPPRVGRGGAPAALYGTALLGASAAGLRRSARAVAAGRAGARGQRRQSHGSHVHRRPQRR